MSPGHNESHFYLLKTKYLWPQRTSDGLFPHQMCYEQPFNNPCIPSEMPTVDSQCDGSQAHRREDRVRHCLNTKPTGARQEMCISGWISLEVWQMEGPMPRRNGAAGSHLQPPVTCRSLGSIVPDLSICQKKLEIQLLIHIMENNSVWVRYLWAEFSHELLVCVLLEPYFLEGDIY